MAIADQTLNQILLIVQDFCLSLFTVSGFHAMEFETVLVVFDGAQLGIN
jgi:hypothetical protein